MYKMYLCIIFACVYMYARVHACLSLLVSPYMRVCLRVCIHICICKGALCCFVYACSACFLHLAQRVNTYAGMCLCAYICTNKLYILDVCEKIHIRVNYTHNMHKNV